MPSEGISKRSPPRERSIAGPAALARQDLLRQIARHDLVRLAEQNRPLDRRFQLAHVARPWIVDQHFHRLAADLLDVSLGEMAELVQRMLREQWDVDARSRSGGIVMVTTLTR